MRLNRFQTSLIVVCYQLQDVADRYQRPTGPSLSDFGEVLANATTAAPSGGGGGGGAGAGGGGEASTTGGPPAPGFVVKGGPWEQRAPDTASTHEFPTMPGAPRAAPAPPPAASAAAWGPRR